MGMVARLYSALALLFAIPFLASSASAQDGREVRRCGPLIERIVITDDTDFFDTQSVTYVPLPGASVTITVPASTSRCIAVRFNAETACSGGGRSVL